ncbi:GntR family transcriptional regulator [Streptomyces sp. NPDC006285]|uniref:GntR family transcriptional regulator n=1 Tax=Streptomyces sp. NPDC006285 TaxID=3364742 RepID=UPI0036A938CC
MRDVGDHVAARLAATLQKEISDGTWKAGTVRTSGDLARRFKNTRYVIHKAVTMLREDGIIESRTGGGGGIAPRGIMSSAWPVGTRRTGEIQETVRKRIDAGTYPVGEPLPTLASLGQEFGVAKSTMSRALRPLRDEGILAAADSRTVVTRQNAGA